MGKTPGKNQLTMITQQTRNVPKTFLKRSKRSQNVPQNAVFAG